MFRNTQNFGNTQVCQNETIYKNDPSKGNLWLQNNQENTMIDINENDIYSFKEAGLIESIETDPIEEEHIKHID